METIVFLGPTLPISEAKAIFPQACYHAPARCGDILRVLRLKPKNILLIDGYFETTPSVWHKEILFAIETGVAVYGASSMGALRAAELANFGMVGLGQVFQDYYGSLLNEDDAVAVIHTAYKGDYTQRSESLVDLRATLDKYCAESGITEWQKEKMVGEISSRFYPERCLDHLMDSGQNRWHAFSQWVQNRGLVRQKALDAIEALKWVKNAAASSPKSADAVPKTSFFLSLIRKVNISPFIEPYDWLPKEEQALVMEAQNDRVFFRALSELAFALSAAHDLACSHPFPGDVASDSVWQTIRVWVSDQTKASSNQETEKYVRFFTLLFGYEPMQVTRDGPIFRLFSVFAFLFSGIDRFLETYPYVFEWKQNGFAQHLVGKYHSLEKVAQAAAKTASPVEEQGILITKLMRYYSAFKGAIYNSIVSTYKIQSFNYIIIAKQAIQESLYV